VVTESRATFCTRLRAARERRGVSLEQIAASTKINVSLLRGLEGADVSRWPKGLYRRSYLRDYLRAVGLPTDSTVAEFLRLFPDGDEARVDGAAHRDEIESSPLSLTLGEGRAERSARARGRVLAALVDAGIVLVLSGAAALLIPADVGAAVASVTIGYYFIATASLGRTFGAQWVVDRSARRWRRATASTGVRHPFRERIRRLRELSLPGNRSTALDIARVPWTALLLRIRFLR